MLIAAAYAAIAATPGLMLGNRYRSPSLSSSPSLQPWLSSPPPAARIRRQQKAVGDRVQQYQLLKNLGTTMEQTAELDELLPRLATAVRDGIGASWVRVRLREADGLAR